MTNGIDKGIVAVNNRLEVYTLQEVTIKECRQVIADAFACEFQHSLFHGPQFGERYAGLWSGDNFCLLAVIITDMAQVDVEHGFYLFDVAADGLVVNDAQDASLAMTQIEVDVRIVAQDGFLVPDILEGRIISNAVDLTQSILQEQIGLGTQHLVNKEVI